MFYVQTDLFPMTEDERRQSHLSEIAARFQEVGHLMEDLMEDYGASSHLKRASAHLNDAMLALVAHTATSSDE